MAETKRNICAEGCPLPMLANIVEGQTLNALKVMMVWVSWMPGMICTFSLTKWPMSVPVLDIELHQQVEVAGGGIDLGGDLGIRERVGDLVGFAELAFDLHEEGGH